jgi:hypothetical protein
LQLADEAHTTTATNSSQQLTIKDDLDILFQNTLYVRFDDEESDDETMEEEVIYRPTYNMPQEINNSDTVPTAQNPEILVQTQAENTSAAEQTPLGNKMRPKSHSIRTNPLGAMVNKKVKKRLPQMAASQHTRNHVQHTHLSHRQEVKM